MSSSLTRGLKVLDALVAARRPLRLADIAHELALSKSSVHGLLATLIACDYVEHLPGGIYRLGLKAWRAGHAFPTAELIRVAAPIMEGLVEQVHEGAILGVLNGFDVVYVHLVESAQVVRVHAKVGDRLSAHCTSTGLALLAFQDSSYLDRVIPGTLAARTPETITNPAALRAELARVRMRGYSVNRGGWSVDVGGVAAPIAGSHSTVAGLCVAVPRYRMTQDWIKRAAPVLLSKAAEIARALDAVAAPPDRVVA